MIKLKLIDDKASNFLMIRLRTSLSQGFKFWMIGLQLPDDRAKLFNGKA